MIYRTKPTGHYINFQVMSFKNYCLCSVSEVVNWIVILISNSLNQPFLKHVQSSGSCFILFNWLPRRWNRGSSFFKREGITSRNYLQVFHWMKASVDCQWRYNELLIGYDWGNFCGSWSPPRIQIEVGSPFIEGPRVLPFWDLYKYFWNLRPVVLKSPSYSPCFMSSGQEDLQLQVLQLFVW